MFDWMFWIGIDIILIILLTIFIWSSLLDFIDIRTEKTRDFIKKNEGFFSVFFIILFATEQAFLIGLTTYFKDQASLLRLIISIFALVVITTASLQKFLLETKRRYDNETKESIKESNKIITNLRRMIKNYKKEINDLMGRLSQKEK